MTAKTLSTTTAIRTLMEVVTTMPRTMMAIMSSTMMLDDDDNDDALATIWDDDGHTVTGRTLLSTASPVKGNN
jgi:hypothetical protein